MTDDKIRLGGMALANGVLVHGPTSWACAIRHPDGRLEVASARKRFVASRVSVPLLRGPARLAAAIAVLPGELAAYHGAEHISIGEYEHGPGAQKEHERCGGHLVGPLLLTSAVGNVLAGLAPERMRNHARSAAQLGALGASTEIFAWMTRHPQNTIAQALSKPGHELQHRLTTVDPTPSQLEVAEAALRACLELERDDDADEG